MAEYQILATKPNLRVDKYIASVITDVSRTKIQALIKAGYLHLSSSGKKILNINHLTAVGEEYKILIPENKSSPLFSSNTTLDILYEDDYIAVINKPSGITVHPGIGTQENTLVDLLLQCYGKFNLSQYSNRPGIVHRLDKDTSGLMIIAKNDTIHAQLAQAIEQRAVSRKYIAIVSGILENSSGTISANIAPDHKNRSKMKIVYQSGKKAITHYKLLYTLGKQYSIVECSLETGRTHQIRVHMKYMGHPVIGDKAYGIEHPQLARQALHAYKLEFVHPVSHQRLNLNSDVPNDMKQFCTKYQ